MKWSDFRQCKWPAELVSAGDFTSLTSKSTVLANAFAALNTSWLSRRSNDEVVISYSHFVPRQELFPEKRYVMEPHLHKVIGSDALEQQIRSLCPQLHIVILCTSIYCISHACSLVIRIFLLIWLWMMCDMCNGHSGTRERLRYNVHLFRGIVISCTPFNERILELARYVYMIRILLQMPRLRLLRHQMFIGVPIIANTPVICKILLLCRIISLKELQRFCGRVMPN